jgi:hypothetical protein
MAFKGSLMNFLRTLSHYIIRFTEHRHRHGNNKVLLLIEIHPRGSVEDYLPFIAYLHSKQSYINGEFRHLREIHAFLISEKIHLQAEILMELAPERHFYQKIAPDTRIRDHSFFPLAAAHIDPNGFRPGALRDRYRRQSAEQFVPPRECEQIRGIIGYLAFIIRDHMDLAAICLSESVKLLQATSSRPGGGVKTDCGDRPRTFGHPTT